MKQNQKLEKKKKAITESVGLTQKEKWNVR